LNGARGRGRRRAGPRVPDGLHLRELDRQQTQHHSERNPSGRDCVRSRIRRRICVVISERMFDRVLSTVLASELDGHPASSASDCPSWHMLQPNSSVRNARVASPFRLDPRPSPSNRRCIGFRRWRARIRSALKGWMSKSCPSIVRRPSAGLRRRCGRRSAEGGGMLQTPECARWHLLHTIRRSPSRGDSATTLGNLPCPAATINTLEQRGLSNRIVHEKPNTMNRPPNHVIASLTRSQETTRRPVWQPSEHRAGGP